MRYLPPTSVALLSSHDCPPNMAGQDPPRAVLFRRHVARPSTADRQLPSSLISSLLAEQQTLQSPRAWRRDDDDDGGGPVRIGSSRDDGRYTAVASANCRPVYVRGSDQMMGAAPQTLRPTISYFNPNGGAGGRSAAYVPSVAPFEREKHASEQQQQQQQQRNKRCSEQEQQHYQHYQQLYQQQPAQGRALIMSSNCGSTPPAVSPPFSSPVAPFRYSVASPLYPRQHIVDLSPDKYAASCRSGGYGVHRSLDGRIAAGLPFTTKISTTALPPSPRIGSNGIGGLLQHQVALTNQQRQNSQVTSPQPPINDAYTLGRRLSQPSDARPIPSVNLSSSSPLEATMDKTSRSLSEDKEYSSLLQDMPRTCSRDNVSISLTAHSPLAPLPKSETSTPAPLDSSSTRHVVESESVSKLIGAKQLLQPRPSSADTSLSDRVFENGRTSPRLKPGSKRKSHVVADDQVPSEIITPLNVISIYETIGNNPLQGTKMPVTPPPKMSVNDKKQQPQCMSKKGKDGPVVVKTPLVKPIGRVSEWNYTRGLGKLRRGNHRIVRRIRASTTPKYGQKLREIRQHLVSMLRQTGLPPRRQHKTPEEMQLELLTLVQHLAGHTVVRDAKFAKQIVRKASSHPVRKEPTQLFATDDASDGTTARPVILESESSIKLLSSQLATDLPAPTDTRSEDFESTQFPVSEDLPEITVPPPALQHTSATQPSEQQQQSRFELPTARLAVTPSSSQLRPDVPQPTLTLRVEPLSVQRYTCNPMRSGSNGSGSLQVRGLPPHLPSYREFTEGVQSGNPLALPKAASLDRLQVLQQQQQQQATLSLNVALKGTPLRLDCVHRGSLQRATSARRRNWLAAAAGMDNDFAANFTQRALRMASTSRTVTRPSTSTFALYPLPLGAGHADIRLRAEGGMLPRLEIWVPESEIIAPSELEVTAALCKGTFGTVFKGKILGDKDWTVAIKLPTRHDGVTWTLEELKSVTREIETIRILDHPAIVRYHGLSPLRGSVAVVMELLPNGNLFDLLFDGRVPLSAENRLDIAISLTSAIAYLHNLSPPLVHRDIKTANIIMDASLKAKLCDFGKTRREEPGRRLMLDENGGSPRYMAPEAFWVGGYIGRKTDIWSLGCCLIEIFGGPVPFEELVDNEAVVTKLLRDLQPPTVPGWFCPQLRKCILSCLSWTPTERPSALEVLEVLKNVSPATITAHGMDCGRHNT